MVFERDGVNLAEVAEAVGTMARIVPSHSRARTEFWEVEAPFEPGIFLRQEAVVEVDVMREEDAVAHEVQEAARHLGEERSIPHHVIRDARQLHDP